MMNFDFALEIPRERPISSIGFTGTRRGMTQVQRRIVEDLLLLWLPVQVHHGDCVGADAEFHRMVRQLVPDARIIIHPPHNPQYRAFCEGDEYQPERPYLKRNKEIVNASQLLLATPGESAEQWRSGTWSTIRHARQAPVWVRIVLPDEQDEWAEWAE
jgi:hypothetical protein